MGGGMGRGDRSAGQNGDGGLRAGVVSMWLSSPPPGVLTVGFGWFVGLSGLPGMQPRQWAHTTHRLEH